MEDHLQIKMNDFLPLRDVVFNTLRQAILRGDLNPESVLWKSNWQNSLV